MRTTAKPVVDKLRRHILKHFGSDYYTSEPENKPIDNLVEQISYMRYNDRSTYQTAYDWVEGGSALISYFEVNQFLESLDINPAGKAYDDEKAWKLYCHLVAREMTKLYERATR